MTYKFQEHKHSVYNSECAKSGTHLNFLMVTYLLTAHCKTWKNYRHMEAQQDLEANKSLNSIFLNALESKFELNVQFYCF